MRYTPTLTGERNSEDRLAILLSRGRATGDSFVIHFHPKIVAGRMRYASTLTDERDLEDRSAI